MLRRAVCLFSSEASFSRNGRIEISFQQVKTSKSITFSYVSIEPTFAGSYIHEINLKRK